MTRTALTLFRAGLSMALVVCFMVTLATAEIRAAEAAKRPNILLIYSDDQSYKTVGCYPESPDWVETPNLDRLAASGIRFRGGYLGAWCMPSRATILTGHYPHAIESMRMAGQYPGATYDPKQCPFWPSVFREQGYHTAQIGKWHTGNDAGFGRDWDYQIVWNRPKHPENAGAYYDNQALAVNGEERTVAGYSTDNYTRWACEYIRGEHRDAAKPWFLWLCYGAVHGPTIPAERHQGSYRDKPTETPQDIFPPRPGKPKYLLDTQAWVRGPNGEPVMGKSGEKLGDESSKNPKTQANFVRQMNECTRALDEGVGQVIAALKESGQLENTLVVYTADQGFSMGEHGFRTKLGPYDANYRSPLMISRPGTIPERAVSPHSATGADLVVTFFAHAGLALPWKMHGHDLTPLLRDPKTPWSHPVFFEHMGEHFGSDTTRVLAANGPAIHSNVPWWVAVLSGHHKYIRTLAADETEELYDLEHDPEELTNLASQPAHRQLLTQLRQATIEQLRQTDAGFIDHLPNTASP
jgi:arylsulfatase A-like enzyme